MAESNSVEREEYRECIRNRVIICRLAENQSIKQSINQSINPSIHPSIPYLNQGTRGAMCTGMQGLTCMILQHRREGSNFILC